MTNNVSAVLDDAYNYSMWVEIYNKSATTSYNQSVYYFTDLLSEPKKWTPGSKIIPAGGYSILYFERDDRPGHANFKLEPEGGKLFLLNASAQIIDSVTYPPQYRNISYGRKTNGATEWVLFEQFSPGTTNNGKIWASERCGKPVSFPVMNQNMSYARVPDGSKNWRIQTPTCNLTNGNNTKVDSTEIGLLIYPTMVSDYFIVANADEKQVQLIDLTGKMLMNRVCNSDKETIYVNHLQRGIYIVVVGAEKFKIIKM